MRSWRRCSTAGCCSEETLERLLGETGRRRQDARRSELEELIQKIIEKTAAQGYITTPPDLEAERERRGRGRAAADRNSRRSSSRSPTRALDFLGYRALRDLLGSIGKSSLGRHDTREHGDRRRDERRAEAVRVRRHDQPRRQRDDAQRRQCAATPSACESASRSGPLHIDVDYEDLMVVQGEYQSSCATVLMLDCSHSMILYGEDRFTPAKRVALALAKLIDCSIPATR